MVRIDAARTLLQTLARIDRDLADGIGDYSRAAANTDRVREAIRTDRRIPADAAEVATRRAVAAEGRALDLMIETLEDATIDARRRTAVAALVAAGITCPRGSAWLDIHAAKSLVQVIRELGVCRQAIARGTNPAFGRSRGAELAAELAARGIDAAGYLPT